MKDVNIKEFNKIAELAEREWDEHNYVEVVQSQDDKRIKEGYVLGYIDGYIKEKSEWHNGFDEIKPKDQQLILTAIWWDYWNYEVGYYVAEDNSVHFFDKPKFTIISLEDVDYWTIISEPKSLMYNDR